jgi:hypothetical protein
MYYNILLLYYIIILSYHRRICGPSLTETASCGVWLYNTALSYPKILQSALDNKGNTVLELNSRTCQTLHVSSYQSISAPHGSQWRSFTSWSHYLREKSNDAHKAECRVDSRVILDAGEHREKFAGKLLGLLRRSELQLTVKPYKMKCEGPVPLMYKINNSHKNV